METKFKPGDVVVCVDPNAALQKGELYTVTACDRYVKVHGPCRGNVRDINENFYPERFVLAKTPTYGGYWCKTPERMAELVGKTKVDAVVKHDEIEFYKVNTKPGGINVIPATKRSFVVGDRVRCVNPREVTGLNEGDIYTVTRVGARGSEVDLDNGRKGYFAHRFELATSAPGTGAAKHSFKPGDRLRLVDDTRHAAMVGSIAIVQDPPFDPSQTCASPDMVNVKWEPHEIKKNSVGDGQQCDGHYYAKAFELAEGAPPTNRLAFSPGDRIVCIEGDNEGPHGPEYGATYTVREYRLAPGDPSPQVRLEETGMLWRADRFRLADLTRRGEAVQRVMAEEKRRLQRPLTMADKGYWQAYNNTVFKSKNPGPAPVEKKKVRKFPFHGSNPFNLKPWPE